MTKLKEQLEQYDFPLFITAEWGQPDRLLKLLDVAGTDQIRKVRITSLLGDMQADEALPRIKEVLKDRDLAKQAAVALGSLGKEGILVLVEILNTSQSMELQAVAAKRLGQLGGGYTRRFCSSAALTGEIAEDRYRLDGADGGRLVLGQNPGQAVHSAAV